MNNGVIIQKGNVKDANQASVYIKRRIYFVLKRVIDVVLSGLGLIFLSPIMLIIALAIKIDSKGPALFKQERTGRGGVPFLLYKFRSMAVDNDVHNFSEADRHTKVGTFIRKTSLDELPQLINVLKGDMSFIGPRPWITDYYENMNEEQRHRCDVLPGITGLAQAKGRNGLSIFEKINYDLEYVKNFSFSQDVMIIFWTIQTVLSKEGADAGKNVISNEIENLKKQNDGILGGTREQYAEGKGV